MQERGIHDNPGSINHPMKPFSSSLENAGTCEQGDLVSPIGKITPSSDNLMATVTSHLVDWVKLMPKTTSTVKGAMDFPGSRGKPNYLQTVKIVLRLCTH